MTERRGRGPKFPPVELVRVTLLLDRTALEDLELLLRHRHRGFGTRSAVVREAIGWLRAREAASLVRFRDAERRRAEREAAEQRVRELSRQERDALDQEQHLARALALATDTEDVVG